MKYASGKTIFPLNMQWVITTSPLYVPMPKVS